MRDVVVYDLDFDSAVFSFLFLFLEIHDFFIYSILLGLLHVFK